MAGNYCLLSNSLTAKGQYCANPLVYNAHFDVIASGQRERGNLNIYYGDCFVAKTPRNDNNK